jgi:2-oxoglutarate dehydrogenase E2 component (dihydrolipoamide succinyltransferase)
MSVEVVMPQMGESITEGTVSKWLKNVGDKIDKDEPILEISTDKVDAEVPSPGAGTILEIRYNEGDTVEVVMPQMGESITEGTVSKWLKAVGDKIDKDEALLEISTDKVDAEVPSPAAGTVLAINVQEGETVEVGSVLASIGAEGATPARCASSETFMPRHYTFKSLEGQVPADAVGAGRCRPSCRTWQTLSPATVRHDRAPQVSGGP